MTFDLTSLVIGFLFGSLATMAVGFPRVGRILSRVLATAFLGAGIGLLVWAVYALSTGGTFRPVGWDPLNISEPSEAFGWAGGLIAAGVCALVLSFIGRSEPRRA